MRHSEKNGPEKKLIVANVNEVLLRYVSIFLVIFRNNCHISQKTAIFPVSRSQKLQEVGHFLSVLLDTFFHVTTHSGDIVQTTKTHLGGAPAESSQDIFWHFMPDM